MTRTAIVTGAYGAIGQAIAEGMANKGFHVVMVGRDPAMLEKTRDQLLKKNPASSLEIKAVDLSLQQEILTFSQQWKGPLHVLVNNAATAPKKRTENAEGIEMQFAQNVLGYFRMTHYFLPFMKEAGDARIVNVASYYAGSLDLSDLEFKRRKYDNDTAYRQSKQANRMLTAVFAEQLKPYGISVNACHPGDVNSKISNSMGFGGHETPEEGAATPIWLATSPELQGITGGYFEHLRQVACPFTKDREKCLELFRICNGIQKFEDLEI
ncbi:MAG: SDR family NAD(P)-dependent oxidoreductase [Bacteroidetes bacterium]|nr:SDR family NAD(P)-dependent oxidoreductase [Bacteroidota bacterium]